MKGAVDGRDSNIPGSVKRLRAFSLLPQTMLATSNKCHASSNKCLTSSNKKLLVTSATLLGTSALLVVTKSY